MKKVLLTAACILIAVCLSAQDGKNIYKKYSGATDVSSVYISPAMFKLIGKLPNIEVNDSEVNFGQIVRSMRGMYVIDSSSRDINSDLCRDVDKFVRNGQYELLMEVNDNGEKVNIYVIPKGETVSSFVLIAYDADSCTFVCLDGDLPLEELRVILEN